MIELIGLPYSPWSEKARWALEARGVPYRPVRYQPLIGEPALRLKLRRFRGVVTVPVLVVDDAAPLADSLEIARWADERGAGPVLFPPGHEAALARFVELSERGLAAGRALSLSRMLDDDAALREMVPRSLHWLGGAATQLGRLGIRRTLRKYGATRIELDAHARNLAVVLDELRAAITAAPPSDGKSGARPLFGAFSFADIAMAQVLAFVDPPRFGLRLGKSSRRSFTDPDRSAQYADLLAWRDAIYEAHRPRTDAGALRS